MENPIRSLLLAYFGALIFCVMLVLIIMIVRYKQDILVSCVSRRLFSFEERLKRVENIVDVYEEIHLENAV